MAKHSHLTIEERNTILLGIQNNSPLCDIAKTIGKDPTTVKKEIMNHREKSYNSSLSMQCSKYKTCKILKKFPSMCNCKCQSFELFYCKRRDKTPGACNGCELMQHCHYTKYKYSPSEAQHTYEMLKIESREGYNLDEKEVKEIANIIKPLLTAGQSPYHILENNKNIKISERTLYTYIEEGVFKSYGIDAFLLRRQLCRKIPKRKRKMYKKRKDYSYLQGRKYIDFLKYMEEHPNASVVEMDTVYNDIVNGPFIQTFKFLKAKILFAIYHTKKTEETMNKGVDILEEILGKDLFRKYVNVLLTDRGSEFIDADGLENDKDGNKRTIVFYCDPMQSSQKGSLERNHVELRYHFPDGTNLYELGLVNQEVLNLSLSHLNSMSVESLEGKSNFAYAEFMFPDLVAKIKEFGLSTINPNSIILTPMLFKK